MTDSIFIRLVNDGDKVVGAFCGEPFPREVIWNGKYYEDFDPDVHVGKRPSLRIMLNFFVPAENKMKVFEGGVMWFRDVLRVRDKYGLDEWLFEVQRFGAAGNPKTIYTIRPEKKIDAEMRLQIDAAKMHDLGDPNIQE